MDTWFWPEGLGRDPCLDADVGRGVVQHAIATNVYYNSKCEKY
jgi:hypothetical protein